MRFAALQWLILLLPIVAAGWFWPRLHLLRPLRMICALLTVVILAEPQVRRFSDALDLWVLVDRSDSVADILDPSLPEWQTILNKSKSADDRLFFVDYAGEAVLQGATMRAGSSGERYSGPRDSTKLHAAATFALAQMDPARASRLLVFSDGFSTDPLRDLAERLQRQSVPLDYRLIGNPLMGDARIAAMDLPLRAQLQEAFLIEVTVASDQEGAIPVELYRNDQRLGQRDAIVERGIGRVRFADRAPGQGAWKYEARLIAKDDPLPGNNRASRWVEVQGGPRVLLVSAYANDPMVAALTQQGFAVDLVTELASLNLGSLSSTRVVILNNVPAYRIDTDFLRGLDFFVHQQGGGLAMIGGKYSFASGGYFGSPVEPLLPISMELKQEHRKLAVALAIVMDRSGSMGMSVPGTSLQKMDLANEGAARAIDLLGNQDLVTVFAVDSEAHRIAPLSSAQKNRDTLVEAVRRVDSGGGGIYVYNGLKAAWDEIKDTPVGQRHIILFADSADAEQPGDYIKLLDEMAKAKATVSVIGLGTDKDSDAAFLQDVAKRGNGRIFFNANAQDLPALFAQETVAVARTAFIEDPIGVQGTAGWVELAGSPIDWLAKVDGYNLSYIRPGATSALISQDEYKAPMLAFWQRGAGRVASVSFPLGGDFSSLTRGWKGYGGFVQSLTRWLLAEQLPPGLGLRTEIIGSQLISHLYYDETWKDRISKTAPDLVINTGETTEALHIPWERLEPGHFRATTTLRPDTYVRGAIRVGNVAMPFGPVSTITNPEWQFDAARIEDLRTVSHQSGGAERLDLGDVWTAPRPEAWQGIQRPLIIALILALVLEALQTRTGWLLGGVRNLQQEA
ncbi:MAG: VWA domain-containing protein [Verrucomicrobiales bacterium]|nr:VWA domain-containing protein [Verrucomicrobiales bacterium]MCP5560786.1 VWA domain-containing protein [Verrucomicrobiaceae bacterium]